jgi:sugar phosphate isomerase/epimerase
MRLIGFSTGALAYGDFRRGLSIIRNYNLSVVELSALREGELKPLIDSLDELDLTGFEHISFHAPSQLKELTERQVIELLHRVAVKNWPLIVHPDVIENFELWNAFGSGLCIENMDKRKPIGRTARELAMIFDKLPEASLCLDLGHAHQVDRTMSVAWEILKHFGARLRQLHVSEVNTNSRHDPLSYETLLGFQKIGGMRQSLIKGIHLVHTFYFVR